MPDDDLDRLRAEYARRAYRLSRTRKYGGADAAHHFMIEQRRHDLSSLLHREGLDTLQGLRILEVGCGDGAVLRELVGYGASVTSLHGTDLLYNRVLQAHERLPEASVTCSDGQQLPYASGTFDMVLQFTVFSSVLDYNVKRRMAGEIIRVLKPHCLIIWYDFWLNPLNRQTRGIRPSEIKQLFPGCRYLFRRVTLAPPVTRLLAPHSVAACSRLEKCKLLNTHFLASIRKF